MENSYTVITYGNHSFVCVNWLSLFLTHPYCSTKISVWSGEIIMVCVDQIGLICFLGSMIGEQISN